jgi:hypothetical protein
MKSKIKLYAQNFQVASQDLIIALTEHGGLSDYEARKVTQFFEQKGKVPLQKFEDYLDQALNQMSTTSPAM